MTYIPSLFKTDLATAATTSENQDRAEMIEHPKGLLLIIADGAGGLGGGSEAAEIVIQIVKETSVSEAEFSNPLRWGHILTEADHQLYAHPIAGETTAVIVALSGGFVCGASVGDSGAFLVQEKTEIELTAQQHRKPLLGSGGALPIPYGPIPLAGTLLIATDGLIKYAPMTTIRQIISKNAVKSVANLLIECVRYPSGNLPDNVTVIVCRKADNLES